VVVVVVVMVVLVVLVVMMIMIMNHQLPALLAVVAAFDGAPHAMVSPVIACGGSSSSSGGGGGGGSSNNKKKRRGKQINFSIQTATTSPFLLPIHMLGIFPGCDDDLLCVVAPLNSTTIRHPAAAQ